MESCGHDDMYLFFFLLDAPLALQTSTTLGLRDDTSLAGEELEVLLEVERLQLDTVGITSTYRKLLERRLNLLAAQNTWTY